MFAGRSLLDTLYINTMLLQFTMSCTLNKSFQLIEKWSRMRPITSLLANTDGSFLNNLPRGYSTLVGISPNFTTVVQIRMTRIVYNEYNAELIT